MFWGCFGILGVGFATSVEGDIKADMYLWILEDLHAKSDEICTVNRQDTRYQQDNACSHKALKVRQYFEANSIEVMTDQLIHST